MARLLGAFLHLGDNLLDFGFGDGRRARLGSTHKSSDLVGVLDQMPGVVVHHHFNQHVARKKLPFGGLLLPILDLDHFLHGNQNATKPVLHTSAVDPLEDVALDSLFHARIGMHNIPAKIRVGRRGRQHLRSGKGFNGRIFYNISHYFFHPRIRS